MCLFVNFKRLFMLAFQNNLVTTSVFNILIYLVNICLYYLENRYPCLGFLENKISESEQEDI